MSTKKEERARRFRGKAGKFETPGMKRRSCLRQSWAPLHLRASGDAHLCTLTAALLVRNLPVSSSMLCVASDI